MTRTPVIVGVGQASERLDAAGYLALSPVDLAAAAVRVALADTGASPGRVAEVVDTVAGVRQFEISLPGAPVLLGRSDNYPRSVAGRVGAGPRRAILEVAGGQAPQKLVTELAREIAAGNSDVALVFGSEAISTAEHLAGQPGRPDWTEHAAGSLEDRGAGLEGIISMPLVAHGLYDTVSQYALFENARRARLGLSRAEYAASMGRLLAPFTEVAARNPHSAAPQVRTAAELVTPTGRNRVIAEPYPRFVVAREKVNQAAAVLVMSDEKARALGIPEERWVHLAGHADLRERDVLARPDLSASPATAAAVGHALEVAGVPPSRVRWVDLYSCYPIAVFVAADALGRDRELTLTGGLPFFGGPGNDYSMHAIAEVVRRTRQEPGSYGFVGANGGLLSKFSAGVYTTTPTPWREDRSAQLQRELDAGPGVPVAEKPHGAGTIETWTVTYSRAGARSGVVVGRLRDGRRFVARAADDRALALLETEEPVGARIAVQPGDQGNIFST